MHEMSLCESILRITEQNAAKGGFLRVRKVRLALGSFSGASRESLAFCFPIVVKGTVAEGAVLEFIDAPDTTLRVVEIEGE
ncbi:MAG: hydrogenase maturation nickel metallochaperone HypA [Chlorobiales bacterium]|nr:hydrogenase maturation nickel metallochaperone HypA [Chlorobiales bacterium]